MSRATLYCGDALTVLKTLPAESVQMCVTSPPYWGLRDYGVAGQLGLEPTPEMYVEHMVALLREVRRVLAKDGTLWLNMGDCYASSPPGCANGGVSESSGLHGVRGISGTYRETLRQSVGQKRNTVVGALKPKDLVGAPWRVAFALQVDGWWLRSDIVWAKPNPMPESISDRPTKSHEYVFLLTKSERYYYDAAAIAEEAVCGDRGSKFDDQRDLEVRPTTGRKPRASVARGGFNGKTEVMPGRNAFRAITQTRNARTVWTIPTTPYQGAHFATFPEELARRCILAGSRPSEVVLDPFGGSGTVAQVATGNGRDSIYIDLNPAYLDLARQRIGPLLCEVV